MKKLNLKEILYDKEGHPYFLYFFRHTVLSIGMTVSGVQVEIFGYLLIYNLIGSFNEKSSQGSVIYMAHLKQSTSTKVFQ